MHNPSRAYCRNLTAVLNRAVAFDRVNNAFTMWIAALLLTAVSQAALAFECAEVNLASSLVICSDAELMRLADERQEAIKEARIRIGEDRWPALWDNQKAWVRSYSAACGAPADRPPPTPVPEPIRDCFKKAALERIAFLRAYGNGPTDYRASQTASAQDRSEVSLQIKNGVYTVPVLINGILPLQFIVDSGAGDVSLPVDVFLTLLRTGTIGDDDFIGKAKYRLADGSTVESNRFLVRELKVGSHILRNVPASIESVKSTPLLGQSFLSRFSSWALDNDRHVIILASRGTGETSPGGAKIAPPDATPSLLSPKIPAVSPASSSPRQPNAVLCGRAVDYVVDPPSMAPYSGFLGVWTGIWNNPGRLCGGLIVEKVGFDGSVQGVYVYGPTTSSSKIAWKQQRVTGRIYDGGKLTFQDEQGSTFHFNLKSDYSLIADFRGISGNLTGAFEKLQNIR